jgi:ribosomal protein L37E
MMELSVLIPARNEMFLRRTIEDVLEHIEADTEIIAVLDGAWAKPQIPDHPRVTLLYHPVAVGQRAACNEAARLAQGKYVMKLDAHCSVGQGFDRILLEDIQPDWTMVPLMKNLHAFDWVCKECGHRRYQGKSGTCSECGGEEERDVVWIAKKSPNTTAMRFTRELRFKYWGRYKRRQKGDLVETMSILGACWMLSKERYFELNICDEAHGSWGQMGTEVACKTWLSGGKLICSKKTWFAHMFRTQGGDFGFPYPISGSAVRKARKRSQALFLDGKWDKAIHPLSWLIDKFAPVPDWTPSKEILYYTDNRLDPTIMRACQKQLGRAGLPIISVSLRPLKFGKNTVIEGERGPLTMFRQILAGLEASTADIIFFAEHDVLYHPSHFEFEPPESNVFYYNQNIWKIDNETGKALHHRSNHTSQLCASRQLLLEHYRKRVERVEKDGYSNRMGYEPGTHKRSERVDNHGHGTWMSKQPNIDIRHKHNLTPTRWRKEQFRNKRFTAGWTEAEEVPSWGRTKGRMPEFLKGIIEGG